MSLKSTLEKIRDSGPTQHIEGPKRGSIALIIHCQGHYNFSSLDEWLEALPAQANPQLLFIKRATSDRDRWSGHIAVPGGRHEQGESDLETAVREAREEVGVDLAGGGGFEVGPLDQRLLRVSWGRKVAMVLCPFVFVVNAPCKLTPQLSEVSSAFWLPFEELLLPSRQTVHHVPIGDRLDLGWMGIFKPLVACQLGQMRFAAVDLFPAEETKDPEFIAVHPYHCWGVTLGVLSDLFEIHTQGHFLRHSWLPTLQAPDMRLFVWLLNHRSTKSKLLSITADLQNGLRGGHMDLMNRYLAGHFNRFPLAIALALAVRALGAAVAVKVLIKMFKLVASR